MLRFHCPLARTKSRALSAEDHPTLRGLNPAGQPASPSIDPVLKNAVHDQLL